MIVRSRGVTSAQLQSLIARETHSAQFGFLGSPYIVVLQLNEALASLR
jgi:K+-transporting ATPase c subunit